jgi:hypothetical protein
MKALSVLLQPMTGVLDGIERTGNNEHQHTQTPLARTVRDAKRQCWFLNTQVPKLWSGSPTTNSRAAYYLIFQLEAQA